MKVLSEPGCTMHTDKMHVYKPGCHHTALTLYALTYLGFSHLHVISGCKFWWLGVSRKGAPHFRRLISHKKECFGNIPPICDFFLFLPYPALTTGNTDVTDKGYMIINIGVVRLYHCSIGCTILLETL